MCENSFNWNWFMFNFLGNETIPISSVLPSGDALGKFLSGLSGGEASETLMVAFVDPAKVGTKLVALYCWCLKTRLQLCKEKLAWKLESDLFKEWLSLMRFFCLCWNNKKMVRCLWTYIFSQLRNKYTLLKYSQVLPPTFVVLLYVFVFKTRSWLH